MYGYIRANIQRECQRRQSLKDDWVLGERFIDVRK